MARKDKGRGAADAPETGSTRITPVDIQQKEFRESFRGYNERDVDQFLDQVTEEMARLHSENKRLQEQVAFRQTLPTGTASAEAEEIMRRAKAEADRIIDRARGVAGGGPVYSSPPPQPGGLDSVEMVNRYLAREREFLQSLASKIQQHIEAVREDVRTVREVERGGGGPEPAEQVESGGGSPSDLESSVADPPTSAYAVPEDPGAPEYPSPHDSEPAYQGPDVAVPGYAPDEDRPSDLLDGGLQAADDAPVPSEWSTDSGPEGAVEEHVERDHSLDHDEGAPRWTIRTEHERSASIGHVEGSTGASVGMPRPDEDAGEERTLRELFWGED